MDQTTIDSAPESGAEKDATTTEKVAGRRGAKRGSKRANNKRSYHTYNLRLLHKKQNNGKPMGANKNASRVMNNFISTYMDGFISTVAEIARKTDRSTIDEQVITTAVKLTAPRELVPVILEFAAAASAKFIASAPVAEQAAAEK
jgi:hypothetical protein